MKRERNAVEGERHIPKDEASVVTKAKEKPSLEVKRLYYFVGGVELDGKYRCLNVSRKGCKFFALFAALWLNVEENRRRLIQTCQKVIPLDLSPVNDANEDGKGLTESEEQISDLLNLEEICGQNNLHYEPRQNNVFGLPLKDLKEGSSVWEVRNHWVAAWKGNIEGMSVGIVINDSWNSEKYCVAGFEKEFFEIPLEVLPAEVVARSQSRTVIEEYMKRVTNLSSDQRGNLERNLGTLHTFVNKKCQLDKAEKDGVSQEEFTVFDNAFHEVVRPIFSEGKKAFLNEPDAI
jgi:hypothetical protein